MKVRGIVLAAGMSSRMGENKLQLEVDGIKIIDRVLKNVRASKLTDIVLVYGKYDVDTDLPKWYNSSFEQGMSTSIITGLGDYSGDGIMVLLGDMPFVGPDVIDQLLFAFEKSNKELVVPVYKGKRGNPVIIGKKYFDELKRLTGDRGARDIISRDETAVEWVEVEDKSVLKDIDDYASLIKSRSMLDNFVLDKRELITFVGAGGKTTSMFLLADKLKNSGKRVLVTTTTKIYYPTSELYDSIVIGDKFQEKEAYLKKAGSICVYGSKVNNESKLIGPVPSEIDSIFRNRISDYILVEGDGSRCKPIKAAAAHEPVIPALTTKLVGVIGLNSLGCVVGDENVHRVDRFCQITDAKMGQIIDEKLLIKLITNREGLFKGAPEGAELILLLNKASWDKHIEIVKHIEEFLKSSGLNIKVLVREQIHS